jgi:spore germination protein PA/spore germination protein PF
MPSIIGNVKIVSSSGVVQFGDCLNISPTSTSKSYAGSGSFITGDFPVSNNGISATNTNDPDIADASNAATGNNVI